MNRHLMGVVSDNSTAKEGHFIYPVQMTNTSPSSCPCFHVRKQVVDDVLRGWSEAHTAGLSPDRLVDFVLVANREGAGRFPNDKNGVAHFSARLAVFGLDLFPQSNPPKSELREFFFDFSAQAIPIAFAASFSTTRKHPKLVAFASHQ
jgi:hypothetical protein